MQVQNPPKGGVNKGQCIPLKCSCPPGCQCKSTDVKNWHHKSCSEQSYISEYGDIFCRNHLTKCSGYFIKDAAFQCAVAQQANTCYSYRTPSQLLMSLAQGMQAAEFNLSDHDQVMFAANLTKEVMARWHA